MLRRAELLPLVLASYTNASCEGRGVADHTLYLYFRIANEALFSDRAFINHLLILFSVHFVAPVLP